MRHKKYLSLALAVLTFASLALSGCKKEAAELTLDAPFTKVSWNSTKEDIITEEGEGYETYDSVYNGDTYTYAKTYEGKEGTIKYMFDDKDELMCVAWAYGSDDATELEELYTKINDDMTDIYGKSGYSTDEEEKTVNNYGNIWYREEGDIIVTAMVTDENKALQFAFLHPEVSYDENE